MIFDKIILTFEHLIADFLEMQKIVKKHEHYCDLSENIQKYRGS